MGVAGRVCWSTSWSQAHEQGRWSRSGTLHDRQGGRRRISGSVLAYADSLIPQPQQRHNAGDRVNSSRGQGERQHGNAQQRSIPVARHIQARLPISTQ